MSTVILSPESVEALNMISFSIFLVCSMQENKWFGISKYRICLAELLLLREHKTQCSWQYKLENCHYLAAEASQMSGW